MPKIVLAWAIQGPAAGKVLKLSPEDFAKAQKDGWAVPFKAGLRQKPDREATNKAADTYFSKVPGYQNRELVSGERPAPSAKEDAAPKRGRPPKATDETDAPKSVTSESKASDAPKTSTKK